MNIYKQSTASRESWWHRAEFLPDMVKEEKCQTLDSEPLICWGMEWFSITYQRAAHLCFYLFSVPRSLSPTVCLGLNLWGYSKIWNSTTLKLLKVRTFSGFWKAGGLSRGLERLDQGWHGQTQAPGRGMMLLGLVLCQSVRGPAENRENDFIRLSVKKADDVSTDCRQISSSCARFAVFNY